MASAAAKVSEDLSVKDAEILRLIEERRSTPKEEKQRLKEVSKCIKNVLEKKEWKDNKKSKRILEDFKGVRNIAGIKSAKKRVLITKIENDKGECITSRKGIADVFHEFYKRPYEDKEKDDSEHELGDDDNYSSTDVHNNNTEETAGIPEITTEELRTAINKLKKGKSPDSKGIRAEDVKACDDETREMVSQIFNEIIKRNEFTPEDWKKVTIKVIHKEGDVENVSNDRPICSLLALYKLFSTILYGRLYPVLDQKQAEDQAGFRKTYQTTDHLATYRMIEQKCHEWGIKMWTATIDFTKAFDSITHNSIWEASCNVDHGYVCLLRKIYKDQKASVQTDEESEIFDIQEGSKQGDPMSSLLFNSVLQFSLKDEIQRWQKKKGMGIYLSDHDHDCLTNLRFADDVMLFATSKEQIQKMLCELKTVTEKVGLRIHPDMTKILSNQNTINADTKKSNMKLMTWKPKYWQEMKAWNI